MEMPPPRGIGREVVSIKVLEKPRPTPHCVPLFSRDLSGSLRLSQGGFSFFIIHLSRLLSWLYLHLFFWSNHSPFEPQRSKHLPLNLVYTSLGIHPPRLSERRLASQPFLLLLLLSWAGVKKTGRQKTRTRARLFRSSSLTPHHYTEGLLGNLVSSLFPKN